MVGTSGATNWPMLIAETTLTYGGTIVDINTEDNLFTEFLKDKKYKIIIRENSTNTLKIINEILKTIC
jgi:NAD-dependent deacetylase